MKFTSLWPTTRDEAESFGLATWHRCCAVTRSGRQCWNSRHTGPGRLYCGVHRRQAEAAVRQRFPNGYDVRGGWPFAREGDGSIVTGIAHRPLKAGEMVSLHDLTEDQPREA